MTAKTIPSEYAKALMLNYLLGRDNTPAHYRKRYKTRKSDAPDTPTDLTEDMANPRR